MKINQKVLAHRHMLLIFIINCSEKEHRMNECFMRKKIFDREKIHSNEALID